MKKIGTILLCFIMAVLIVFVPVVMKEFDRNVTASPFTQKGLLTQGVSNVQVKSHEIIKIYNQGQLVGVLTDQHKLNQFLKRIYQEKYKAEFPASSVSLANDVYISREQSFYLYEDIDEQIFSYLEEKELFSLRATSIEFSDSNGVYAEIFVTDEALYRQAMDEYLSLFIDQGELAALNSGKNPPELKTYGSRAVGIQISQEITTKMTYASVKDIKKTKDEVLEYLKYGSDTEKKFYTVQEYDTVAGVGAKNGGLSAVQVMNINRDKISDVNQILKEGDQLCVTYFNSPIDVIVNRENLKKEIIYPSTVYIKDENIRAGKTELRQSGVNGSKNSLYDEKWINGVLVTGELRSSVDTLQPQDEVLVVGTLVLSGVGTGSFRWPADNPLISCRWGCYFGHRAIDIQNRYDHYGNIYAADAGVVEINSYNGVNGNYLILNHNNGYQSYYGHMNVPSPLKVGTAVEKGDIIGQIGMTGWVLGGPHIHFFIMYEGVRYDPCSGFLDCEAIMQ